MDLAAHINQPTAGRLGEILSIEGSSNAAGVVAGVAALVWSRYPDWTNQQVRQRLESHTLGTAAGFGVPNAYTAVGGFGRLELHAQNCAIRRYESTLQAGAVPQGDGPFTYRWSNGATTQTTEYPIPATGTSMGLYVEVTDTFENKMFYASHTVRIVEHLDPCEG